MVRVVSWVRMIKQHARESAGGRDRGKILTDRTGADCVWLIENTRLRRTLTRMRTSRSRQRARGWKRRRDEGKAANLNYISLNFESVSFSFIMVIFACSKEMSPIDN